MTARTVPIAVSSGTFYPRSTLESIRELTQLGIEDIELTLQENEFSLSFERKLSMPILPEISPLVQSGEICVRSVHAPSANTGRSGYNLWARRQLLIHSLEVCRRLGARLLVIHPFHLFRVHEEALDYLTGDHVLPPSALLPGTTEVLDLAQSTGIRLALENIQDWADEIFFNSPKSMVRFLRDVNHPALGVTLDLMHAKVPDLVDEFMHLLGTDIINIHASDLRPPTERVPIGRGIIDWQHLVPALVNLPNLHQITVELQDPPAGEVIRSVSWISAFMA
jgi:sugar phosphate isomerase/epimerase